MGCSKGGGGCPWREPARPPHGAPWLDGAVQNIPKSRFFEIIWFFLTTQIKRSLAFPRERRQVREQGTAGAGQRGRAARRPSSTAMPTGGTRSPSSVCASAGAAHLHLLLPGALPQPALPKPERAKAGHTAVTTCAEREVTQTASSAWDRRSAGLGATPGHGPHPARSPLPSPANE